MLRSLILNPADSRSSARTRGGQSCARMPSSSAALMSGFRISQMAADSQKRPGNCPKTAIPQADSSPAAQPTSTSSSLTGDVGAMINFARSEGSFLRLAIYDIRTSLASALSSKTAKIPVWPVAVQNKIADVRSNCNFLELRRDSRRCRGSSPLVSNTVCAHERIPRWPTLGWSFSQNNCVQVPDAAWDAIGHAVALAAPNQGFNHGAGK